MSEKRLNGLDLFFSYFDSYISGDKEAKKQQALALAEAHPEELRLTTWASEGQFYEACLCYANEGLINGAADALKDGSFFVVFCSLCVALGDETAAPSLEVIEALDNIIHAE